MYYLSIAWEFYQTPSCHIGGQGCPECCKKIKGQKLRMTRSEFIRRASLLPGNEKYDYSEVVYTTSDKKVRIKCDKHGFFEQTPHAHLNGNKCPLCAKNKKMTQEEFIQKAKAFNPDYDYSLVNYVNISTPVKIICPKHGEFIQIPKKTVIGHGCPHCRSSNGEKYIKRWLDDNNIKYKYQYFIRLSNRNRFFIDFFLDDFNIFIEFNGQQHYEPVNLF